MLEERKVQKAKITLMRDPRFALWSGILMVGRTSVVDNMPTACTNGRDEKYGRKFVADLKESELNFVVLHENLHKAFRHTTVWKHLYKDWPQLANMACDYVINQMIVDSDPNMVEVALPECGLLDPKYKGMDSGAVYRDLKKQYDKGAVHVKTVGDQEGKDIPVEEGDGCDCARQIIRHGRSHSHFVCGQHQGHHRRHCPHQMGARPDLAK